MKQISKFILVLTALLVSTVSVIAQTDKTYNNDGGVSTYKQVDGPNSDGSYTITLETFATGTTTVVSASTPVDVILVLDLSSSMKESYSYKQDDGTYKTGTRLEALIYATKKFVAEIARNDEYDDEGNKRDKVLGNRIQIITYNTSVNTRFTSFQPASTNLSTITTTIDGFSTGQGTRTDSGLSTAINWVNTSKNATYWTTNNLKTDNEHNIVVVMFTDGCPSTSGSTNFTPSYAISAVNNAKTIKDNGATVYSVGLIDWDDLEKADENYPTYVRNMMDYISSNFPGGTATSTNTFTCTGTRESSDYYKDANEVDLGEIFESIAHSSGGSSEEIGSSTQVRDIVSSSFVIPEGTTANDITIKTQKIKSDGTGWLAEQDVEGVTPVISTNTAGNSTLTVQGFDYSKDDTVEGDGTGNWVGIRKPDPKDSSQDFWAGQKLIIRFNVKVNEGTTAEQGTTGGITQTNTPESGVYVYNETTEEYECVNNYTVPATVLPINIIIKKSGLRSGESASFEIWKIAAKTDEEGNIVYNAIGKPQPGEKEYTPKESDTQDDILKGKGWDKWSKVVITNKTATNGATITKTLLSLDPNWVYMVTEDDWGWAYETTGAAEMQSTSTMIINPYTFTNKEKTGVIKHAEAVSINHFATSANGTATEEHYKSSKVKSF